MIWFAHFSEFQIFPSNARDHLSQKHPELVTRLKELPGREHSIVIAKGTLLGLSDGSSKGKTAPKAVLCDICIFSPRKPVLFLTITSGGGKKEKLTRYNSHVTGDLVQHVRRSTRHSFSPVYGLIEESQCQTLEMFTSRINQLEKDATVMCLANALHMTPSKCLDIVKTFLQLLPTTDGDTQAQAAAASKKEEHQTSSGVNENVSCHTSLSSQWNIIANAGQVFGIYCNSDLTL